jgi:hypothetical protein
MNESPAMYEYNISKVLMPFLHDVLNRDLEV